MQIIESYQSALTRLSGMESAPLFNSPVMLDTSTIYLPEDFEQYQGSLLDAINPNEFMNLSMQLDSLKSAINACDSFVEGEFCDSILFPGEYQHNYHIKSITEGDKLYIESYDTQKIIDGQMVSIVVHAELVYFDIVDGNVEYQYVRDTYEDINGSEHHRMYYDQFLENVGIINTGIEMNGGEVTNIIYRNLNIVDDILLEYSISSFNQSYALLDRTTNIRYGEGCYQDCGNISIFFMNDRMQQKFSYIHSTQYADTLEWNLAYVDGWDYIKYTDSSTIDLYMNDTIILPDDRLYVKPYLNKYASISRTFDGDLTEDIFNLYDGLSVPVSYQELHNALAFMNDDTGFQSYFDFTHDNTALVNTVKGYFPKFADEVIVQQLMDAMKS